MYKRIFFVFNVLLLILSPLSELLAEKQTEQRKCFVLTIPKSGTNCIMKLLFMMTNKGFYSDPHPNGKSSIINNIGKIEANNKIPVSHLQSSSAYRAFSASYPEYLPIIQIRDLRDVLVSYVYFFWWEIENKIGPTNVEQKLLAIIKDYNGEIGMQWGIYNAAQMAIQWLNDPNVLVIKFEDIVGEKGGGSRIKQEQEIIRIANALNIDIDQARLKYLADSLFGSEKHKHCSVTFRQGQVGSWKEHFKKEHRNLFKKHWGNLQLELGYSIDD